MPKALELTGERFGRLVVLEKDLTLSGKGQGTFWKCKCDCGQEIVTSAKSLTCGKGKKSCGCLKQESDRKPKGNVINIIGKTFGHLTVLDRNGSDHRGEAIWKCRCDCEEQTIINVLGSNLRTGHTTSCGCDRRSKGEKTIIKILNENGLSYECEKIMFKYSNGYNAKFDFYIDNKYLIEYDGETHFQANLHGWHTLEQLKKQQEKDAIKNQWCKNNNIPLIRIPYTHLNDLCIEDLLLETSQFKVN